MLNPNILTLSLVLLCQHESMRYTYIKNYTRLDHKITSAWTLV